MSFGYDETTQKYGYYVTDSEGADTFSPFKSSELTFIDRILFSKSGAYSATTTVLTKEYTMEQDGTVFMCGSGSGGYFYDGKILHNGIQVQYYTDGACTQKPASNAIHLFQYAKFDVKKGDVIKITLTLGGADSGQYTSSIDVKCWIMMV